MSALRANVNGAVLNRFPGAVYVPRQLCAGLRVRGPRQSGIALITGARGKSVQAADSRSRTTARPGNEQPVKEAETLSVSSPWFAASAMLLFAAISVDTFGLGNYSLHLLETVDSSLHIAASGISTELRYGPLDRVVSNIFIDLGLAGWSICTLKALLDRRIDTVLIVACGWFLYFNATGPIWDPWLMDTLKNTFHRIRPSDIHSTFSYPSGHTSSVCFLLGSLLFVILPSLRKQSSKGELTHWLDFVQGSWPLWLFGVLWTATARVMADAHWATDTMAGACVGALLVCVFAAASEQIEERLRTDDE